jgi:hypothetical protein
VAHETGRQVIEGDAMPDDRRKASEPPQMEFDFGPSSFQEDARFLLQELDKTVSTGNYTDTIRVLKKFNDYVWKTFYKRSTG